MTGKDIKEIVELAGDRPIEFVSANLTIFYTRSKLNYVFLDDTNLRMYILRPYHDPHTDTKYPFEVTCVTYDQIETANILMTPDDVNKFVKDHGSELMYDFTADHVTKQINDSPIVKNFNPTPYTESYKQNNPKLYAQVLRK